MTQQDATSDSSAEKDIDPRVTELQEQLNSAEQAKLRALADLENFRRRESESRAMWSHNAVASWAQSILPSLQELLLGAEHTEDADVQKVIAKFMEKLKEQGLEKIDPIPGEEINPDEHAVLMTEKGTPGTIVQVLESGWKLNDTILVPAKVSGAPLE